MRIVIIMFLAGIVAVSGFSIAVSQDEITQLSNEEFAPDRRAPAVFNHDEHNELAGIEECSGCHHGGSEGVIDFDDSSEGTPCVDCHPVKAENGETPLMRAYHRQCIGCHKQEDKGPQACGSCHVKQ